jgi:hypothetical protein
MHGEHANTVSHKYSPPSLTLEDVSLYKHSQLSISGPGQIRLLKLLPDRGATSIACEIIHTSMLDLANFLNTKLYLTAGAEVRHLVIYKSTVLVFLSVRIYAGLFIT